MEGCIRNKQANIGSVYIHGKDSLAMVLKYFLVNPYKHGVLLQAKSANQDQTPQNVASDQGFHCLLTECSIIT